MTQNTLSMDDGSSFAARFAELRQKQLSAFDDDSLAWLAMTPAWTERLAQASHFPTGRWNLREFLTETEKVRLAQRGPQVTERDLVLRRIRGLMALWPFLDAQQRERLCPLLRQGATAITDAIERLRLQIALAPFGSRGTTDGSPSQELRDLLTAIDAQSARSKALLMAQLVSVEHSPAVVDKAVATLRDMSDPEAACRLLSIVIAAFPDQTDLVEMGRGLATGIDDPETRANTLLLLAAPLADSATKQSLREEAISNIFQMPQVQERVDALIAALNALQPPVLDRAIANALEAVRKIANPVHRAQVLVGVGRYVQESQRGALTNLLVETALHAAEIRDPVERDAVLAMIAVSHALIGDTEAARVVAATIEAPVKRSVALLEIAGCLPEKPAAVITAGVFNSWQILPQSARETLLLGVPEPCAKYLPRAVTEAVARSVEAMISDRRFAPAIKLLNLLKSKQKTAFLQDTLTAVFAIGNEPETNAALMQLAPHLPKPMLDVAIRNLVEVTPPDRPFWMPEVSRQDVIQYLCERPSTGLLQSAASRAGQAILLAVEKERLDIAPATIRWAQIAARCSDLMSAASFANDKVYAAVEVGDLGNALEYAKATTELASSLGQQLELAVAQVQHRIGLAYRSAADERHLARFLPRKEYSDAVAGVLADATPHWAIHFLGAGGVGKTMLMRQLTARLAVKDGKRLATSRVDFDHINPEFPVRKPGELLAVLAEELRIFGGTDQEDRYRKFHGDLTEFHGALSAVPPPEDPLQNIEAPAFERLLQSFAALLHGLPKPVVLILDTCEELARLDPIGTSLPSVEATFRIIERVHEREPGIRVVFGGRRLLARSGGLQSDGTYAWSAHEQALPERNRILPARKDYLRLQVMRGFSEAEADDYFSRIVGIVLDPAHRDAILKRSRDPGIAVEIDLDQAPSAADAEPRYNPFDLSLYADWVKEDRTVSAGLLGSGETDPYVEMRIMRRIGSEGLRDAIPYAVLLRRFDMDMLRPVASAVQYDLAQLFRDLSAEEWMEYQQDALQVDTKFLPRLQHYFEQQVRRHLLGRATARLGPELVALVRKLLDAENPFNLLRVWHIDAALRLAPEADAAALWETLDRHITDSANWHWAAAVCRSLLDKGNAAGDDTSWLRAAVCATYNAALVHVQSGFQARVREAWGSVAELSRRHPIVSVRAFIAMRSRLWTDLLTNALVTQTLQFEGDAWQREQLAAALAAAMERELEKAEPAVIDLALKNSELRSFSPEMQASLACSLARFFRTRDRVRTAKRLAARVGSRMTTQRWADWRAPASLASRIRLELLRIDPSVADWTELDAWGRTADVATIDGDRLLSRTLMLRLEYAPVEPPSLEPAQIYDPKRRPECRAHIETLPLIAPFVDAVLSQRLDAHCLELVSDVRMRALKNQDAPTVDAAGAIKLKLDRRLRTAAAMQALADLVPTQHPHSSRFHHKWAVHIPGDVAALREQLDQQFNRGAPVGYVRPDGSVDLHSSLDFYEGELLGAQTPETRSYVEEAVQSQMESDRAKRRDNGETISPQLEFRMAALMRTHQPQLLAADRERPRRLAEMALDEGELLALRLPDRAVWLFEEAHRLFTPANDPLGESLAAICAAMASCRAGDRTRAIEWLERAGAEYQLRDPPEGDPINAWILRAAACAAWIRERDDKGPLSTWVSHALAQRYGSAIPPELAFASAASAPAATQSANKNLIYFAVGIGTTLGLAALLVWMFVGTGRWLEATTEFTIGLLVLLALLAIVSFEMFLLWLIWRPLRGWYTRAMFYLRRQSIIIDPNRDGSVFLQMEIEPFAKLALPVWPLKSFVARMFGLARKQHGFRITQPDFRSYSKDEQTTSWFQKLRNKIQRTRCADLVSFLFVNPSVAHYPWEAIIGLRTWPGWKPILATSGQIVRAADVLPHEPKGLAEWISASILVVSRGGLAAAAWKNTNGVDTRAAETWTAASAALRVLHLIGRARRGASGTVFSIGGQGSNLGELVSIDRLPLSDTAIVIIQEEPAERVRRLDVDREQAADARDWAAQVFRAGAHTVIFIPAMPFTLAEQSIGALAAKLDSAQAPNIWRMIKAVRAARAVVIRFKGDRGDVRATALDKRHDATRTGDLRELALEITLFTRSDELQPVDPIIGFTTAEGSRR